MRRYLLDSGPLAAYLNGRRAAVELLAPRITLREVATSVLVYGEVVEYFQGLSDFPRRQAELRRLLREVYPYFLTYPILSRYAEIRRQLRPPYGLGLIGAIDTLIAATALARNLTIVTTDTDFQRVPDLNVMLLPRRT